MKTYFLTMLMIFAVLFSFKEVNSSFMQIENAAQKSCMEFEQNDEEDCAVIDTYTNLNNLIVLPIIISECISPVKRVFHIWKPPVNA